MYLIDFSCYKPPEELKVNIEDVKAAWDNQSDKSIFSSTPLGCRGLSARVAPAGPPSGGANYRLR
eukprot:gene23270-30500_t